MIKKHRFTQKWYGKKWVKRRMMAGGIGLEINKAYKGRIVAQLDS